MNTAERTAGKTNGAGRYKNSHGYKPDVDLQRLGKQLRENSDGRAFFSHLSVETEIRICLRYLADEDYRLTKISQDFRTRPANVREMLGKYGVDVRNRVLNTPKAVDFR